MFCCAGFYWNMVYGVLLCWVVLQYDVVFFVVLGCIAIFHCAGLYCNIVYYVLLCWVALQYGVLCFVVLGGIAICCMMFCCAGLHDCAVFSCSVAYRSKTRKRLKSTHF